MILFGEGSLRRAVNNYVGYYHEERNHQGNGNLLLFSCAGATNGQGTGSSAMSGTFGRPVEVLSARGGMSSGPAMSFLTILATTRLIISRFIFDESYL
jgi:hypothetical protein